MNTSPPVKKHSINYTIRPWGLISATLWGICLAALLPHQVDADDLYHRAEQTDADYAPARIEELRDKLKSDDAAHRRKALSRLQQIGIEARSALPIMVKLLEDEDSSGGLLYPALPVSSYAVDALESLGVEVVPEIARRYEAFTDDDLYTVVRVLAEYGAASRQLLPQLRDAYQNSKEDKSLWLSRISEIDPTGEVALPLIREAIKDQEDDEIREAAVRCLIRVDPDSTKFWPYLQAAHWFDGTPDDSAEIVDLLLTALKDSKPELRAAAIAALGTYPEHEGQIVEQLSLLLDDHAKFPVMISNHLGGLETVSQRAVDVLLSFSSSIQDVSPVIIEWYWETQDPDLWWMGGRDEILARVVPETNNPLKHLRKILKSQHPQDAFLTVAQMGTKAQSLSELIEPHIDDRNSIVAATALMTLACIDPRYEQQARTMIIQEFQRDSIDDKRLWDVLSAFLRQVGTNAAFSKPVLKEILKLSHQREDILYEFEEIVDLVTQHLSPNQELLDEIVNNQHRDEFARYSLDELLIRFGPTTMHYYEAMVQNTETSAWDRVLSLRVLGVHGGNRETLIPLMLAQLDSPHPAVREATVETLGQM